MMSDSRFFQADGPFAYGQIAELVGGQLSDSARANELASETFDSARRALEDARSQGLRPASDSPLDTHEYVAHAFDMSEGLADRQEI